MGLYTKSQSWLSAASSLLCVTALIGIGTTVNASTSDIQEESELKPSLLARVFTIEDYLSLQEVGQFEFSPDGLALAFDLARPRGSDRSNYGGEAPGEFFAGDVWVQLQPGGRARNITRGAEDGTGWWAPKWSPDGKRLALLSTRDGLRTLWIWERAEDKLKKINSEPVAPSMYGDTVQWIDSDRLIVAVKLPDKFGVSRWGPTRYPELPQANVNTASVLESGVPIDVSALENRQLLLFDISNQNEVQSVVLTNYAASPLSFITSQYVEFVVSPNSDMVAVRKLTDVRRPQAVDPEVSPNDQGSNNRFTVEVYALSGKNPVWKNDLPVDVVPGTLRWIQGGHALVVQRRGEDGACNSSTLELMSGQVRTTSSCDMHQVSDGWSGSDRVRLQQTVEQHGWKPTSSARIAAWSSKGQSVVYLVDNDTGTFAWRVSTTTGEADLLIEANQHLADIAQGEWRSLSYTSMEGEALFGHVLLPPDYTPNRTVPLVVWVYPGKVFGPELPATDIGHSGVLDLQLLAAQGFAVLTPSIPLSGPSAELGTASREIQYDPILELRGAVMPAIDALIEDGVADRKRIYVVGHSYGGYGVFGLIGQSDRFAAAISLAGRANEISSYGTFNPWARFTGWAHILSRGTMGYFESGRQGLGTSPWGDPLKYLKNSPILYAEQINTPVLIVQGDQDYVALQQGEEMFSALYRLGRRATFVRYWGEEHSISARPANIRDFWRRTIAWLDKYGDIARDSEGRMLYRDKKADDRVQPSEESRVREQIPRPSGELARIGSMDAAL